MQPHRLDIEPGSISAAKEWSHWLKTFENYIEVLTAALPEERRNIDKLKILINCVSHRVYDHVEESETYDEAIRVLKALYVKTPNKIFARHLLATAKQKVGQSLDDYLLVLTKLSKDCNFANVTGEEYRKEMIRDAFINGITSHSIRQRLLENAELSLEQAFETARTLDSAQRSSEVYVTNSVNNSGLTACAREQTENSRVSTELQSKLSMENTTSAAASNVSKLCYFCGRAYHNRTSCPAKYATCYKCNKKGHFSKVCRSKSKDDANACIFTPNLCAIQPGPECLKNATVVAIINGTELSALIDTGSSTSFINKNTAKMLKLQIFPRNESILMASSNLKGHISGQCVTNVNINGVEYSNVLLKLMNGLCTDILLGHDFQSLHEQVVFKFNGVKNDFVVSSEVCALSNSIASVPSLFSNVSRECKPIAVKSRQFNKTDQEFINSEISRLCSEGIIKPSVSPWRAQVVIVKDAENNKRRMCIDYSQTINLFTELDAYPLPRIDVLVNNLSKYQVFSTFDLRSAYHQIPIAKKDRAFTAFEAGGKLWEFTRIPFGVTNGVPAFQREMDKMVEVEGLKDTFPYLDNITVAGRTQKEHDSNVTRLQNALTKRNWTLNDSKTISSVSSINILGYCVGNNVIKPDPDRLEPLQRLSPPENLKSLKRVLGLFAYYAKWILQFSDKIQRLKQTRKFPLDDAALRDFESLKKEIKKAALTSIDENLPFVVECDASDVAISATLNQGGRPVAFMSRSFQGSEIHYPAVEKEATAIIEAVRKWSHFLSRQPFVLITDQRSVAFMLDNRKRTKIKNNKIQCWRLELASFCYTIKYRPGKDNTAADSLSRAFCASMTISNLMEIHAGLCHPGVTRLLHFVRTKNLPFSTEDVRRVCSSCQICAELKPRFYKMEERKLVKATQAFERISLDFKGPLPSSSQNKYILMVIDEYSRFPFAFPCPNMHTSTVIRCLDQLFSLCGMPCYVHSDNAKSFISKELKDFLTKRGVASSKSSPYHPTGNSQVERYNGVVWKAIRLALKSHNLPISSWENVLPDALHSVRSLLNTNTNCTPHERFLNFNRRSPSGSSLPAWLTAPGPVLLRKFVKVRKNDDLTEQVQLIDANPTYANVRYADGREGTVSIKDLAPCPEGSLAKELDISDAKLPEKMEMIDCPDNAELQISPNSQISSKSSDVTEICNEEETGQASNNYQTIPLRRSTRTTRGIPPVRYGTTFSH